MDSQSLSPLERDGEMMEPEEECYSIFKLIYSQKLPGGGGGVFPVHGRNEKYGFFLPAQVLMKTSLLWGCKERDIFLWFMPSIAVVSLWGYVIQSVTTLIPLTNEASSNEDRGLWESLGLVIDVVVTNLNAVADQQTSFTLQLHFPSAVASPGGTVMCLRNTTNKELTLPPSAPDPNVIEHQNKPSPWLQTPPTGSTQRNQREQNIPRWPWSDDIRAVLVTSDSLRHTFIFVKAQFVKMQNVDRA